MWGAVDWKAGGLADARHIFSEEREEITEDVPAPADIPAPAPAPTLETVEEQP